MISIRSAISDLEKSEQLQALTLECYRSAMQDTAEYAVARDDEITAPHRKHLKALADGLAPNTTEALAAVRATFRALVRDYRDQAARFLGHLRDELSNTAASLKELTGGGTSAGDRWEACPGARSRVLQGLNLPR